MEHPDLPKNRLEAHAWLSDIWDWLGDRWYLPYVACGPWQQYYQTLISAGPALVNFGRSLYAGIGFAEYAAWLLFMGFGGLLVR